MPESEPVFFAQPEEFRKWLAEHHRTAPELWVGFYKRDSGLPSITWPESVDAALCFGWIDGIRKSIDQRSYKIRFTPRRHGSIWSAVNMKRFEALRESGLVAPAGLAEFEARKDERSAIYAYEQRQQAELGQAYERLFRKNRIAWKFFQSQPPWYRRTATYWVTSAKREETRLKRLGVLIDCAGRGEKIPSLRPPG